MKRALIITALIAALAFAASPANAAPPCADEVTAQVVSADLPLNITWED